MAGTSAGTAAVNARGGWLVRPARDGGHPDRHRRHLSPPHLQALLARVLSGFADPAAVDPLTAAGAARSRHPVRRLHHRAADRPAPAARPHVRCRSLSARTPPQPQPGDLLLRRALGEPGLGHAAFIAGQDAYPPDEA